MNNRTKRLRNYLTGGEVADIFEVAPRTVSKWFDAKLLRGWKIPGSNDRRFCLKSIREFARVHGFTSEKLGRLSAFQCLLLTGNPELEQWLADALGEFPAQLTWCNSFLSAGVNLSRLDWDAVIADCTLGRSDVLAMIQQIPAMARVTYRIVLTCEDETRETDFTEAGANLVMRLPVDMGALAENLKVMLD